MRSGAELENLRAHGPSMVPTDTKDQPAPQPACLPEPPSSASPPPSHSAAMSLDPPPEELVGFLDHPQHASSTLRVPGLHAASISEARLQHALRESVPPKAGGTFDDTPVSPPRIVEISPPSIAFSDVTPAGNPGLPKATQAHPRQPELGLDGPKGFIDIQVLDGPGLEDSRLSCWVSRGGAHQGKPEHR